MKPYWRDEIMNNDTHMIQNYLALHSLYALDNYSSNLAINMVVETSSQNRHY